MKKMKVDIRTSVFRQNVKAKLFDDLDFILTLDNIFTHYLHEEKRKLLRSIVINRTV